MSRIFDALNHEGSDYKEVVAPIQQQAVWETDSVKEPLPEPPPIVQDRNSQADAPSRVAVSASEIGQSQSAEPANHQLMDRPAFRTLALRIPRSAPLLPFDGSNDLASEEYRLIRTRILHHASKPKVFLVSSACPADGKTVTSINLAAAIALKGNADVLLIDADFAKGAISAVTGVPSSPGLRDVLSADAPLSEVIVSAEQLPRLHILSVGQSEDNPAELLDSAKWARFLDTVRKRFGYIVLDSPPVDAAAYYGRLQAACDGIVLVVRPEHTKRTLLNNALQTIPQEKLLGVVVNRRQEWVLDKKGNSSYAYYGYSEKRGPQRN